MVVELDVPWAQPVASHKFFVTRRTLVLGVTGQHALDAHADTLHILDGTPSLLTEEVKTDEAVCIDMWVHRNGPVWQLNEGNLWRFYKKFLVRLPRTMRVSSVPIG